jgi:uncharacterized protein YjbI with pentapeptide repeats
MSEPLERRNNHLESAKSHLQDLSQEEIKARLKQLSQYRQDPVAFEYELVKLSKDWQTSIEECHHLWTVCEDELETEASSVKRHLKRWRTQFGKLLHFVIQYSILFGVIAFLAEAGTRERQAINAAWEVINNVGEGVEANAGRGDAIEFLNKGCIRENQPPLNISLEAWRTFRNLQLVDGFFADCINLKGLDLHNVHLLNINLPYAKLHEAQFNGADLEDANFSVAELQSANFEKANLQGTDLSGIDSLRRTDLRGASLKGTNLTNANLRYVNLTNANLEYANLEGANLQDVDLTNTSLFEASLRRSVYSPQTKPFEQLKGLLEQQRAYLIDVGSKLEGADLEGIDLRTANLNGAILESANLQKANLRYANLTGTNLQKVNFRGTDLSHATLHNAYVKGAIYDSKTRIPYYFWRVFRRDAYLIASKQNLSGANLQNMDLQESDLQEANLEEANLARTNLRKANLRGANLTNANFQEALYDIDTIFPTGFDPKARGLHYLEHNQDLNGVYLRKFDLEGINLVNSDLQKADLQEANLREANLSGANLREAVLVNANLNNASLIKTERIADLQDADLRGADLREANLQNANLKNANLEGTNLIRATGLTPEQIKQAKNWEKAQYDAELRRLLRINAE